MKTSLLDVIATDPIRDRGPISRGLFASGDEAIKQKGGSQRAGLIEGASIITEGEALGHEMWIDGETLDQVVELGNSKPGGFKVRFTHPEMSGDGLGSYLGRAKNFRREDDKALADIHFSPSSRETPDGDLGGYVMTLAEDDSEVFAMSMVFEHDRGAEKLFEATHSNTDGDFVSPVEENDQNFRHVRLSIFHGADFVDEPAANPGGLFHRGPTANILKQADAAIAFVLGMTDVVPSGEECGGLSVLRLKGFFSRFLKSRGVTFSIQEVNETMTENTETVETEDVTEVASDDVVETNDDSEETTETTNEKPVETTDDENSDEDVPLSRKEVNRYVSKFGAEKGWKYLSSGTSFEDALEKELNAANAKLATRPASRGEEQEVPILSGGDSKSTEQKRLNAKRKAGYGLPIRGSMFPGDNGVPANN